VQGSAKPSVDAAGLAVLTVDRAALSKRVAESGILKNLSDEGKKKLSNIILSGKTIPSTAAARWAQLPRLSLTQRNSAGF
jgi:hypothetical protein